MIEVCGYIFPGIDEECQVREKNPSLSNRYRSKSSRRAHVPEEEIIQNWIEQYERKKCPFCRGSLPYNAKCSDSCGKQAS